MHYVLAALSAIGMLVMLWKAFRPERPVTPGKPPLAPDDDPEFLRRLDRRRSDGDDAG